MIFSVTHTPSWALWLAFGLGIFNLLLWSFIIVYARRTWRQLKPALLPYIQMLTGAGSTAPTGGVAVEVTEVKELP